MGTELFFKYHFFHTFFLGRYIATRPTVLSKVVLEGTYLRHEGLVEVIAELSTDNEPLVRDIVRRSESAIGEFNTKYVAEDFDPLDQLGWPSQGDEEEKMWKPIARALAAGPRNAKDLDEIKSSYLNENRASNQQVVVQEFDRMERQLIGLHIALSEALRNSDNLPGGVKLKAVRASLGTYLRWLQVGILLSPSIAEKPIVRWFNLVFLNYLQDEQTEKNPRTLSVILHLPHAICKQASENFGSRKLGEVYKSLANSSDIGGFLLVLNFACLVRAKPKDWLVAASTMISKVGRNRFYLSTMLSIAFSQFKDEVNTMAEREEIKRLIAVIKARRDLGKQNPGVRDIDKIVERLEQHRYFERTTTSDVTSSEAPPEEK